MAAEALDTFFVIDDLGGAVDRADGAGFHAGSAVLAGIEVDQRPLFEHVDHRPE